MYLELFNLSRSPFAESPDTEIFFPGARREEVCQSLILDILAGKPLLKLVGLEGSGKTLICRLIDERLPATYHVVFLEHPIDSFDDLLHIVCLDLGMDPRSLNVQADLYAELQSLLDWRHAHGIRVVLIADEAEKLLTTALEQLVHHVGEKAEELDLTLLLSGRPELDAGLEQMVATGIRAVFNAAYLLKGLSESETRQYLRFRANAVGMSREQFAEVFTEGAVTRILKAAKGNLRLLNILAEEVLHNVCAEKSFMVLLDHVEPAATITSAPPPNRLVDIYEMFRDNRMLTGALAGAMVLVVGMGIFLSRSAEKASFLPLPASPASSAQGRQGQQAQPPIESVTGSDQQPLPPREQRDGQALFRERLGAGATWLAAMYKGCSTIQLMMLSSDAAQDTLVDTLTQDAYYLIRNQLYIIRKRTNPPALFVFYGLYDNLDAAREARNSMPSFLQKHHPYPLAISEAMGKIEH